MDQTILEAVERAAVNGQVTCAAAHAIAAATGAAPAEVGAAADQAGLRISRCQMGFFGYGPKAEGKHRIVLPAAFVPEEIEAAIRERTTDGRISCLDAWELADRFEYPRLGLSNIIERLGIRVKPCQLGCF